MNTTSLEQTRRRLARGHPARILPRILEAWDSVRARLETERDLPSAPRLVWERDHVRRPWEMLVEERAGAWALHSLRAARFAGIVAGVLLALAAVPAAAQTDPVELRTPDGAGVQKTRLSVTGGGSAEVKLFATFNANSNLITGLAAPSAASDAATKAYVDSVASGGSRWVTIASDSGAAQFSASGADTFRVVAGSGLAVSFDATNKAFSYSIAAGGVTSTMLANSSLTVTAGTGLTGGGTVSLGGTTTLGLANTAVAAGSYGSASSVATFTVDAQGRLTAASNVTISGVTPGGTAGGDLTGTYPNPTIAANAVALGTDTTGNYQAGTAAGSGIAVGGTAGEEWSPTISLGSLTGDWSQGGAYDIKLASASSELRIMESSGGAYYGTFDVTDLAADRTYTFPNASGTVPLGTGSSSYVAFWSGANSLTGESALYWDATNDRLGVGIVPDVKLAVYPQVGSAAVSQGIAIVNDDTNVDINGYPYVGGGSACVWRTYAVDSSGNQRWDYVSAKIAAITEGGSYNFTTATTYEAGLAFYTRPSSNAADPSVECMRISAGGNVGIGTASPGAKLDVSGGNVRTTGQLVSTASSGAPLSVNSATMVANLNADMLDGKHAGDFLSTSAGGAVPTGAIVFSQTSGDTNLTGAGYAQMEAVLVLDGGSWTPTNTFSAPSGRAYFVCVWTGSVMIVWGGYNGAYLTGGMYYDPTTNAWYVLQSVNQPTARGNLAAVWTGTEMIVWGGTGGTYLATGGRYNHAASTWTATSVTNAPVGRVGHKAIWTGTEMIVWGGFDGNYYASGGRYDPSSDTWTATSLTGAPAGRTYHTAVWSGTEMIVWGGNSTNNNSLALNTGGRYSPSANSWTATGTTGAPGGRQEHTAVWTGTNMVVWGGHAGGLSFNTGGQYNPATNSWTPTNTSQGPAGRRRHSAIWTGTKMVVWGGASYTSDTVLYDPSADRWILPSTSTAPTGRDYHSAVWTGTEMIVWGGKDSGGAYLDSGGRYLPATYLYPYKM